MSRSNWTKDDYLLYYAYVVHKLNSWKYKAAAQLVQDGHRELALKHPCNIDGEEALVNALKLVMPGLLHIPREEQIKQIEGYLFS